MTDARLRADPIDLPATRLCVGVTGHRNNAAFTANRDGIAASLSALFAGLDELVMARPGATGPTRLHSLLAPGTDMLAIELALERGWDVIAPLPFGLELNVAVSCEPQDPADAQALIDGAVPSSASLAVEAGAMRRLAARIGLFELAEQDAQVTRLLLDRLRAPDDADIAARYAVLTSERAAIAGRVMIDQSDLLVAVWDGISPGAIGGTRHSITGALYQGVPVIWIDATAPERMFLLDGPDALESHQPTLGLAEILAAVAPITNPPELDQEERAMRFHAEKWHRRSSRRFHAYRRIETLFGGGALRPFRSLVETYETPGGIAEGSGAPMLAAAQALPGMEEGFVERLGAKVLARFAWADGLSTYLSDAYRGGMVMNFLLSAAAIITGAAYLPLGGVSKWPFALVELVLLLAIVLITTVGRRNRWHGRWLETRRVAEYLRHAPIMLLLGVARPAGRWPRGATTQWPEHYARQTLRELGLPRLVVSQAYLRSALADLLGRHARTQRDYHRDKATKLTRVHHRLDRLSEIAFVLAILSVSLYLALFAAGGLELIPAGRVDKLSKIFTFLGIALPALGGAFAGIRYLGDFERFAEISSVTGEKLAVIESRIERLLGSNGAGLGYAQVASLAHALDDAVVTEIENWQSVFAAKNIAVPV